MGAGPTTTAAEPTTRWRPWASIGLSLLVGPLVGLFALMIAFAVSASLGQQDPKLGLEFLVLPFLPIMWVVTYAIGAFPALLSAALYVWLDRIMPETLSRPIAAMLVGSLITALFWLIVFGVRTFETTLVAAIAGATSGGVCAHITRRWRYRAA